MLALDYLAISGGTPAIKAPFAIELDVIEAITSACNPESCDDSQEPLGTCKPAQDGMYFVFEDGIRMNGYFNGRAFSFHAATYARDEQGLFLAFADDRNEPVKGVNGYALLLSDTLYLIAKFPDPLYNDPDNIIFCVSPHQIFPSTTLDSFAQIINAADSNLETFLTDLLKVDGKTIDEINSDHAFGSNARACLLGYLLYNAAIYSGFMAE